MHAWFDLDFFIIKLKSLIFPTLKPKNVLKITKWVHRCFVSLTGFFFNKFESSETDMMYSRRAKSGVKRCHFVMVDFNKGINIIKHNFLKRFCNVGISGTVLHAAGGSSSAHARNIPANMRDPKNYNFNAHHSIIFFLFRCNYRKKNVQKNGITCCIKPDFHWDIISREILHSSNLIGFAQFSAKKVENISTFFNFARKYNNRKRPYIISREIMSQWKTAFRYMHSRDIAKTKCCDLIG